MHQSIFRPVYIRPDAEHTRPGFSGQPPARYRVMGEFNREACLIRLADSEADAKDKTLMNAAISNNHTSDGQWWIETWNERLSKWVEV